MTGDRAEAAGMKAFPRETWFTGKSSIPLKALLQGYILAGFKIKRPGFLRAFSNT
jgi:hypothetical protein